ncbi:MAG TPA: polyprenyl synthetase family protein [Syntrophales bacterium]|jgi:geranylgeranyl diphosphate synthase type II|nr:polyprenyl synthetase family protein [Syntrophales bacterium]HQA82157.1 polyprenyl synthetase family protein [Syntrophales bacterium]
MNFDSYLSDRKKRVDMALREYIPPEHTYPTIIFQAVRYSLFAGGKRLRPILCMAATEALGGSADDVLPVACALEMIHTYSLIHDDLPAIDNDDYRRGILTNHKIFGESIAILAGDALLTEAFRLLANPDHLKNIDAAKRLDLIHDISEAAGFFGMVGGQVMDVQSEGKEVDLATLHYIHSRKTGAMIVTSIRSGAVLAGGKPSEMEALIRYATQIGLAFQIADDILNIEGEEKRIGKSTGTDRTRGKATYPALVGIEESRKKGRELLDEALSALVSFDEKAEPLRRIARHIVERDF